MLYRPRFLEYPTNAPKFLIDFWLSHYPESTSSNQMDFFLEEFVECVIQPYKAIQAGFDVVFLQKGDSINFKSDKYDVVIGNGLWRGEYFGKMIRPSKESSLANQYYSFQTFLNNSGRDIVLCGLSDDEKEIHLFDVIVDFSNKGIQKAVLKATEVKSGLELIEIPPDLKRQDVEKVLPDYFWDMFINKEGYANCFTLQEFVNMDKEYRFIVIDGELVCGSGTDPKLTPLDNQGLFDRKVFSKINNERVVLSNDLIKKYKDFALKVISLNKLEQPLLLDYTLDVAICGDNMLIVELNPLDNFGLYANDFNSILAAYVNKIARLNSLT